MNLEPKHNSAIREEIGDRLRALLARDKSALPPRLRHLLGRFHEADGYRPTARGTSTVSRIRTALHADSTAQPAKHLLNKLVEKIRR
jgi:hypothetical protein